MKFPHAFRKWRLACPAHPLQADSTRDAGQVWANGGAAVALTLAFALLAPRWPWYKTRYLLMLFLAALSAVNADTWATEIGSLSRRPPRLLTNWKPVPAGTSGAISLPGTLAALAGALFIPLCSLGLWHLDPAEFLSVAWAGFLGSLLDSLLGAGLQAQYRDPVTGALTERTRIEQRKTVRVRGLPWVNNDVVNFLASVGAILFAWILLRYAAYPLH